MREHAITYQENAGALVEQITLHVSGSPHCRWPAEPPLSPSEAEALCLKSCSRGELSTRLQLQKKVQEMALHVAL